MKQRLFLCVSLIACLFVSCKNDDIAVSRDVTFKINPYSIVADFARHEVNTGDLVNFGCSANPDYYKLRCYLLVYDMDGALVESVLSDLNNYQDNMTVSINLSDGSYDVVTIAHIVDVHNDKPCWNVLEMNRLDALKIVNVEGFEELWVKLLGVERKRIEVGVGDNICEINIKPAGSLVINYFRSIHHFSDFVCYQLFMDKEPNKVTFNNDGMYNASYNSSTSLSYPSSFIIRTEVYNQDYVYWYSFYSPMGVTRFEWHAWDAGDGVHIMGGSRSANIQDRQVYMSTIDLQAGVFEIVEMNN